MSCSECIIYKYITKRGKIFAECLTILCLFCSITCILKKDNVSVLHSCNCSSCIWSYNFRICCKFNFLSKKFGKSYCNRCKRQLRFWLSLRLSKMRAEDYLSTVCNQLFDRRKCCYDTVLICDFSIDKRNIEVTSYKDSLSFYINIIY